MCGLAVSILRHGRVDRDRLAAALRALRHRGPDAEGSAVAWLGREAGDEGPEAGMAHARLSILDLDRRSDQPFRLGRHAIVYNGEIYNYRALSAGMPLATSGDTEVLLRLLMRDGPGALDAANGMWAFCWLDEDGRKLTAGRDRYGKKPLFYAFDDAAIHLASEPQALAALLGRPLFIRTRDVDGYMADGWLFPDPSGATHFDGIRQVRPGHALTLDIAAWRIEERAAFPLPAGEPDPERLSDERLAEAAADAVRSRLVSDRKVGLFLSGGVDSTLILSILHALGLAGDVICITGDAGRTDDARYARACIEQLGIEALNLPLPYDALGFEQFLAICRSQAKPFPMIGNVLGMHALYKAVAAHDIRVVLDGTGADEIFGGYWHRYFAAALRDARAAGDEAWIASVSPNMPNSYRHLHAANGWMALREIPILDDLAILRPEARRSMMAAAQCDPLHDHAGTLPEALLIDSTAGRMQEWLWQNDRNAMAASVENRSPFLDYRLAAWLETSYRAKFGGPWNKMELRRLFDRFTPLPTARRIDKQGFRWAFDRFFRGNLEAVLELIGGSRTARRYVDPGAFADAVRGGRIGLDSKLLHRLTVVGGLEAAGYQVEGG
jgi:asparagine synthase (glutamine-hydrolysing)